MGTPRGKLVVVSYSAARPVQRFKTYQDPSELSRRANDNFEKMISNGAHATSGVEDLPNFWRHVESLGMNTHGADTHADQAPAVLDTAWIRFKPKNPAGQKGRETSIERCTDAGDMWGTATRNLSTVGSGLILEAEFTLVLC